jgi:hypothetical protein
MVVCGWITSYGQNLEPEVPGDHFSLEGALALFRKSASPEEFEKLLNSPDSKVNNLDLNGDGYIDYIRVHDRYEGNVHAFIIQAVVSETENQDVAVIELEKLGNGKAVLQIVGDEDIYGVETIIEPTQEVRTYAGSMSAPAVVNVWTWPSVQYVYSPYYVGWASPWGWHHRPVWWHSWRPVAYVHYYPVWRPYHHYYTRCHTRRVVYAHRIYRPYRTTSIVVHTRHQAQISRYRSAPRDDSWSGRDRNNGSRSSYGRHERSAAGNVESQRRQVDRSSFAPREAFTLPDRSASGQRTAPAHIRRNTSSTESDNSRGNRTVDNNREVSPGANRSRSIAKPDAHQRSVPASVDRERSVPAHIQRSDAGFKVDSRNRNMGDSYRRDAHPQVSNPGVSRSRSTAAPRQESHGQREIKRTGDTRRGRN